ncbi:MAG TPA: GntR family transcriptional regulator [Mycobacteriales bacterium]|nr:GntR family transcriptional regulator [Mycobacteriales bacterium]
MNATELSPRGRLGRELSAILERYIFSGRWPTGSKIPAERELAAGFEVSRQTVRDALDELERAGLITRRHGSGTYVAARRLEQSLLGHFSIVESLRSAGAVVGTKVLSQRVVPALPAIARDLGLRSGTRVVELERLRTAQGELFMLERTWMPARLLPGIAESDVANDGLYATLRDKYGIVLVRAVESFEPVILRPDEAAALEDEPGQPALMLLRTTYDSADRPIETARAILRADRCRTLVERRVHEPDRP